jgi:prepilin-type N-terminal cleavage/methylation domain-containing protein
MMNRTRDAHGFSMVELMVVLAVGATALTMAIASFDSFNRVERAASSVRQVSSALRTARETAVSQRRNIRIDFLNPNVIRPVRIEIPNGTTALQTTPVEGGMQFVSFPGLPDTPDAFGNAQPIWFGAANAVVLFTAEGTLVNQAGQLVNGSVFLGRPNQPQTAHAITVFGATALIRMWRWDGRRWVE